MYSNNASFDSYLGRTIDGFRIERLLGTGGMGFVFLARHIGHNRKAAIKFLQQPQSAPRLRDEANAALAIDNPFIVKVFASGEHKELGPYIVFELLEGLTLRNHLNSQTMTIDETLFKVARPLLTGLGILHSNGIIHRDIKPENLFRTPDGRYKIGDLGLALFEGREAKTQTGLIIGTPGYLAPERINGKSPITPAIDCYSAAVVLVECLSGKLPFQPGQRAKNMLLAQLNSKVSPVSLVGSGVPSTLARVLAGALSPCPQERPTADEFLHDFERAAKLRRDHSKTLLKSHVSSKTKINKLSADKPVRRLLHFLPAILLVTLVIAFFVYAFTPGHSEHEHVSLPADIEQTKTSLKTRITEILGHKTQPDAQQLRRWITDLEIFMKRLCAGGFPMKTCSEAWRDIAGQIPADSFISDLVIFVANKEEHPGKACTALQNSLTRLSNDLVNSTHPANENSLLLLTLTSEKLFETRISATMLHDSRYLVNTLPGALPESRAAAEHLLLLAMFQTRLAKAGGDNFVSGVLSDGTSLLLKNPGLSTGFRTNLKEHFHLMKATAHPKPGAEKFNELVRSYHEDTMNLFSHAMQELRSFQVGIENELASGILASRHPRSKTSEIVDSLRRAFYRMYIITAAASVAPYIRYDYCKILFNICKMQVWNHHYLMFFKDGWEDFLKPRLCLRRIVAQAGLMARAIALKEPSPQRTCSECRLIKISNSWFCNDYRKYTKSLQNEWSSRVTNELPSQSACIYIMKARQAELAHDPKTAWSFLEKAGDIAKHAVLHTEAKSPLSPDWQLLREVLRLKWIGVKRQSQLERAVVEIDWVLKKAEPYRFTCKDDLLWEQALIAKAELLLLKKNSTARLRKLRPLLMELKEKTASRAQRNRAMILLYDIRRYLEKNH